MILTSIEKLSESIGYDIGCSYDKVQSDLLNGFCKALYNSMRDSDREMQICYMVDKLTPQACEIIKAIKEFIDIKTKGEE